MADRSSTEDPDAGNLSTTGWHRLLDAHAEIHGSHLRLGAHHGALFTEDDDTLLVTFEDAHGIRQGSAPQLPDGLNVAGREGWSHLCLYSEGETFFRNRLVQVFFDQLVDDGFFEHFEKVIFYGVGPCGYAAAAYSVCAPGAQVLLIRPLASLSPLVAGWDRRRLYMRRDSFDGRYGYAPDMIDAAESVSIIYDPRIPEDSMHAALFSRSDILRLPCPNIGPTPEADLSDMGLVVPILRAVGKDRFDAGAFYNLYRARHSHLPYLQRVLKLLHDAGRRGLLKRWVRGISASVRRGGTTGEVS